MKTNKKYSNEAVYRFRVVNFTKFMKLMHQLGEQYKRMTCHDGVYTIVFDVTEESGFDIIEWFMPRLRRCL